MARVSNSVIVQDPEILSGEPVFCGTRDPFQTLLDYLEVPMGCTAHQRSEHEWEACVHLDPVRKIEPHEGFAATDAHLWASSAHCSAGSGGEG